MVGVIDDSASTGIMNLPKPPNFIEINDASQEYPTDLASKSPLERKLWTPPRKSDHLPDVSKISLADINPRKGRELSSNYPNVSSSTKTHHTTNLRNIEEASVITPTKAYQPKKSNSADTTYQNPSPNNSSDDSSGEDMEIQDQTNNISQESPTTTQPNKNLTPTDDGSMSVRNMKPSENLQQAINSVYTSSKQDGGGRAS